MQPLLNILNIVRIPMDSINHSCIGSFLFLNQPLVNEFCYCLGDGSGFVLDPLMQQPPLNDPFEGIAGVGIVGEIGENVITSFSLFSGWIASHLALRLCIYRATQIIDGFCYRSILKAGFFAHRDSAV